MDIKVFARDSYFIKGVVDLKHLPTTANALGEPLLDVAFWGRSNVGKSSLINSLLNRKKLVKVSGNPGKTREINFFSVDNSFHLVDLPGYGYARVSKSMQVLWQQVVIDYLSYGHNLQRVFLLIDARVGFKTIDFEIMDFLNKLGRSYQIVFTKIEKINKKDREKLENEIESIIAKNPACYIKAVFTSAKSKEGILELQEDIIQLLSKQ